MLYQLKMNKIDKEESKERLIKMQKYLFDYQLKMNKMNMLIILCLMIMLN